MKSAQKPKPRKNPNQLHFPSNRTFQLQNTFKSKKKKPLPNSPIEAEKTPGEKFPSTIGKVGVSLTALTGLVRQINQVLTIMEQGTQKIVIAPRDKLYSRH